MKNYISILLAALLIFSACNKELGKLPENAKVDGNTILDERTARIALNGAYYRLANVNEADNVTKWDRQQRYPAIYSGYLAYGYGEGEMERNIYQNTADDFWGDNYEIVNAANGVITRVEELGDSKFLGNAKNEILAEARFLRAYASFKLLSFYGQWFDLESPNGIIIRQQLVDLGNAQQPRNTVRESYDFILGDIDFAIENGPAPGKNIYANKYTAMALKMRVLLSHAQPGDYDEVIQLADAIINESGYALESNPRNIFYQAGLMSKEVILGVQPQQNQEKFYYNTSGSYWPGRSGLYVAKPALNELLQGDPRQPWLIGPDFGNYTEGGLYFTKYIDDGTEPSITSETAYIFRLTEVYLLKAEAIIRSGSSITDAKDIIKDIMAHAGVTDFSAIDDATTSDALLVELYKEISRSLVAEDGQEWMALLRLPEATVKQLRPTITNKIQYILPVPRTEFLNNPLFGEQNPGYQKL